jgi:hypothetical protein
METPARPRNIIKRHQVHAAGPEPRGEPGAAPASPRDCTPSARLVALDERTQALEFTCSCGEVSLLELQFEEPP